MLLKGCQKLQPEKKSRLSVIKQQRNTGGGAMKLIGVGTTVAPRVQRKVMRVANKRPASGNKRIPVMQAVDPCDSSNDSGLGPEQHQELQLAARSTIRFADLEPQWANESPDVKRKKMEIKLESDDANDNFTFEETMIRAKRDPMQVQLHLPTPVRPTPVRAAPVPRPVARRPALAAIQRRTVAGPPTNLLANQLLAIARSNKPHLQILSQPEQQHRARYQTEGSRGAVKDRTGNSFPSVKLVGHDGPASLQVFIGSDAGRVVPHMFYQACRVSGKNATPCTEKLVDGTVVIEMELTSAKDMVAVCDCVGILKERNVDVEHRFPEQSGSRQNKKKSTRCRMVFRSTITHPDGTTETLEITSQPIVCTQPPGVPEICKKSLASGACTGGQEMFILGKNFLKDTRVVFSSLENQPLWEATVHPDKEYLQQSHLVCLVPPYQDLELTEPITVRLVVTSSGKTSESHSFRYTPALSQQPQVGNTEEMHTCVTKVQSGMKQSVTEPINVTRPSALGPILRPIGAQYLLVQSKQGGGKDSVFLWNPPTSAENESKPIVTNVGLKMMPPPPLVSPTHILPQPSVLPPLLTLSSLQTAGSNNQLLKDAGTSSSPMLPLSPTDLKGVDLCMKPIAPMVTLGSGLVAPSTTIVPLCLPENIISTLPMVTSSSDPAMVQHYGTDNVTLPMATGADLSSTQSPSMATLRQFVSSDNTGSPLPSLSVEKFLSGLEHKPENFDKTKMMSGGILQSVLQHKELFPEKILTLGDSTFSKQLVENNNLTKTSVGLSDSNITATTSMLFHPQTSISTSLESQLPNVHVIESLQTSLNQGSILSIDTSNVENTTTSSPMMSLNVSDTSLSNCLIRNGHSVTDCSVMPSIRAHSIMSHDVANEIILSPENSTMTDLQQSDSILNSCFKNPINVNTTEITQNNEPMLNNCQAPFNEQLSQEHIMHHCQPATTTTITTVNCKQEISDITCDSIPTNHLESSHISATQNARLDALVSSALDTSNLAPQTSTQKLEELVNTAADCHLSSPQIFESHSNFMNTSQSDNTMVQNISMNHEMEPQITSEIIHASSNCLTMTDSLMINTLTNSSLNTQIIASLSPKLEHPNSPLLVANYTNSLEGNFNGLTNASSYIAPIEEAARLHNEDAMGNLPIKNLMIGSPVLSSGNPLLASSIAVKNMILHSASSTNSYSPSTMTMENMMLPPQEHLVTPETVRLDALVNSTLDNHIIPADAQAELNKVKAINVSMHSIAIQPMTCDVQLEPMSHFTIAPSGNGDNSMSNLLSEKSAVDLTSVKMESASVAEAGQTANQKREEGMVPRELTQMSEYDLLSYINPSCFDAV